MDDAKIPALRLAANNHKFSAQREDGLRVSFVNFEYKH